MPGKTGGGTGWSWISYDFQLELIYNGPSNPVRKSDRDCACRGARTANSYDSVLFRVQEPLKRRPPSDTELWPIDGDTGKNATLIRRTGVAEVAITGDQLSVAIRALLDFAAWSVKLPLGHAAVMTGRHVGPPTEASSPYLVRASNSPSTG